jgi:hypothetical protein
MCVQLHSSRVHTAILMWLVQYLLINVKKKIAKNHV